MLEAIDVPISPDRIETAAKLRTRQLLLLHTRVLKAVHALGGSRSRASIGTVSELRKPLPTTVV